MPKTNLLLRAFASSLCLLFVLHLAGARAETLYEAGENGVSNVTVHTYNANAGGNVLTTRFASETNPHSFRLIMDGTTGEPAEMVMLNPSMIVGANSEVKFMSRLGKTGSAEVAVVQVSTAAGAIPPESSWVDVWTQVGTGQTVYETAFNQRSASLALFAGQTVHVRFLYRLTAGLGWFYLNWEDAGWYFDQIQVTNVRVNGSAIIGNYNEAGENGLTNVTVQTYNANAGGNVLTTRFASETMPHSFRLIMDGTTGEPAETVMLNSSVIVGVNSEVKFMSRLGKTGSAEVAAVQVSAAAGAIPPETSWVDVWTQVGTGQTVYETAFNQRSASLALFAGQTVRVRFLYRLTPGLGWFYLNWDDAGWYFDQIQVTNVTITTGSGSNSAPIITSNGGGAGASISVAENTTPLTTVTATDADTGSTLTYSISGGADAARFRLSGAALSFITAPDFENPTDAGANNVYDVMVQVSDGLLTDTQAIVVGVTNANDNAPVITSNGGGSSATVSVAENSTAVTTITATDADAGSALSYSITGGVDASRFTINAGLLAFVAPPNFESPTDVGGNNTYDVTVQASDGVLTDSQAIVVNVTNVSESAPGALTVAIEPTNGGRVTDETGREILGQIETTVGAACTLTATPAPGFVFVGWSGGLDVTPLNTRTISFSMPQTLSVIAKFIAVKGNYNGLVQASLREDRTYESSGRVQITLDSFGSFTGNLKLAAETHVLVGSVNVDGILGFDLGQMKLPSNLRLDLTVVAEADGLPSIKGTVSKSSLFTSQVDANLALFTNALNPVFPYRNVPEALLGAFTFTVSVPGDAGIGSGRILVRDTGNVSVFVTMPDGTKKLDSSVLEQDAEGFKVPIYVSFLQNQGAVCGLVILPQQASDPVTGEIIWFKPADPNRTQSPEGWPGGMDLAIVGSRYEAPIARTSVDSLLGSAIANSPKSHLATVILSGGGLPAAVEIPTLIANNRLVPMPSSPIRRFSLSINPINGKFSGEFKHPITRKSNPIKGVVLQLQKVGAGYFLGSLQSGSVVFSKN